MFVFKIVTPEATVFEENVSQVTLPIESGEITVLEAHMPYIGTVRSGVVGLRTEADAPQTTLATSGGFVEFHGDTLVFLADTAERAESIDLERAEKARERAEELMRQANPEDAEAVARTAFLLEKELARIRVAKRHRTHHLPHVGDTAD
jgi:F-type H+-transporting ATPase subunit epsilon